MAVSNVVCVDIGSTKVCTIIASTNSRTVQILGVGHVPSRGIQKGIVVDVEDATRSIKESFQRAQSTTAAKIDRALVGFSGKHISSSNPMVSVDTDRRNRLVTELALTQAEKEIHGIAFPEGRIKVNIVNRQYTLDRVGGIKNPLGMHGFRLDLEAHIVTADMGFMDNLALCVRRAGVPVSPDSFVPNPLACSEAVLEPEDKEAGVIIADIGGGTTGISVFRDGSVLHTSALPVGGRQVTNDLAIGLSIPFSAAEELKLNCGSLYPNGSMENEKEDVLVQYNTSAEQVGYIIRARMEEILRMITSRLPYTPKTLVLTGGGAKLAGIEQFGREVLGLQTRVGKPRALPENGKGLNDPACAATLGLVLWCTGATEIAVEEAEYEVVESGPLLQPVVSGLSGLLDGWHALWSHRPRVRIAFGSPKPPEDES